MTTTRTVTIDGKAYEADVNFDGARWQVVVYSHRERRIISEHASREAAQTALWKL